MIYDWLMNYNVSINIFLKDHRIMSYCMTESVDGQSDYYRAGIRQNLAGPYLSSSETHCVVRHSWYYFQYSQCPINYPINIRQIYDEVSVKAVEHGTQRIWFIFSTILVEYTQEESSHNTVKVFGGYLSRCSFLNQKKWKSLWSLSCHFLSSS